jgi:hypothetical protein|tara:strand:- start:4050 stop:4289 length:240 start_codon:yes stop_codon:yes gene_type:complete
MNSNYTEKIIELHEAIDFIVTEGTEYLSEEHLVEVHTKVGGAEQSVSFFEGIDNYDRIIWELTTLRDWLIVYIKAKGEF